MRVDYSIRGISSKESKKLTLKIECDYCSKDVVIDTKSAIKELEETGWWFDKEHHAFHFCSKCMEMKRTIEQIAQERSDTVSLPLPEKSIVNVEINNKPVTIIKDTISLKKENVNVIDYEEYDSTKLPIFECQACDKTWNVSFQNYKELLKHEREEHPNFEFTQYEGYRCDMCTYTYYVTDTVRKGKVMESIRVHEQNTHNYNKTNHKSRNRIFHKISFRVVNKKIK